jgi:hypothetical protein
MSYEVWSRVRGCPAGLLMIARNGSKIVLLTEENTADQRCVTARDHPDLTPVL